MREFIERMKADVEKQRAQAVDSLIKMEGALEAIRVILEELDKKDTTDG
jgi:hypothetical protein